MQRLSLIFLSIHFLSSCVTVKKLTYLQDEQTHVQLNKAYSYRIQPEDLINIEIKSPDLQVSEIYNLFSNEQRTSINESYIYLKSYSVDPSGYIQIPVLGRIKIGGATLAECGTLIENALGEHLNEVIVIVKLVSYNIVILGEVKNPGVHSTYLNQLNIFDALAVAGDLTNFGNRKEVKLVRTDLNGISSTYLIDLTSNEVFLSEAFYVYPHDIIYVKPLAIRPLDMNLKSIGILLSATTLVLLILRSIN